MPPPPQALQSLFGQNRPRLRDVERPEQRLGGSQVAEELAARAQGRELGIPHLAEFISCACLLYHGLC